MNFDDILELIAASTDFNRGILTGIISTVNTLYSESVIDEDIAISIIDKDFNHDDINLLRDSVLQMIKESKGEYNGNN